MMPGAEGPEKEGKGQGGACRSPLVAPSRRWQGYWAGTLSDGFVVRLHARRDTSLRWFDVSPAAKVTRGWMWETWAPLVCGESAS
jgi:hypothetical protein